MAFSSFSDDMLLKAMDDGLERYVERTMNTTIRTIASLEKELKDRERRNDLIRWHIENATTNLDDLQAAHKRIQMLKLRSTT